MNRRNCFTRLAHRFELRPIAFALALLLPLESSHCMWMSASASAPSPTSRATSPGKTGHDCCAEASATSSPVADVPPANHAPPCPCLELPPAAPSPPVVTPAPERVVVGIVTGDSFVAPLSRAARDLPIALGDSPPPDSSSDCTAPRGPPLFV